MKYIYSFIVTVFFLASCDLDREPFGMSNFWNTEGDAWLGINSVYEPYYHEEAFGRGQWWVGPASDDMVTNRDITDIVNLTNFTATTNSSGKLYENWNLMYLSIKRANDVLKNVPNIAMSEKAKDIILGEANFLCAYNYFFLAKRYGGLPFYDFNKPQEINKKRETKEDTYKMIEAYLLKSIEYFEKQQLWKRDSEDVGRPNLGAAYGLLAKVYAHWAHGDKVREKYTKCKVATEKVIGQYNLNTTGNNGFADLFSPNGEKHEEVLFNLTNAPVRNRGTITSIVLMPYSLTGGKGWSYFAPTQSLRGAYDDGDLRRKVTMVGKDDEVNYLGKKHTVTGIDLVDMTTGYMCAKYASAYDNLTQWQWETGADVPLLRLSDVLLIHAEAVIILGGGGPQNRTVGVADAADSFNKVRVRAYGGDASKAISAPNFNDLMKERRCELAYEDERHFDLVRWGLAKEVYAAVTTSEDPRGSRTFDPVKNAHFPLPQKEIENSDFLLINNPNPGYSSF